MAKSPAKSKTAPAPAEAPAAAEAPAPAATEAAAEAPAEDVATEAAAGPTAFQEILDTARAMDAKFAPQHAKEDNQTFFKRVIRLLADINDAAWEALSLPAQEWYNEAADALTNNKAIPDCPGFTAAAPAEDAKPKRTGAQALMEHNAKRKAEKEAAIARGEAPPKQERKPAEPKEPRGDGVTMKIRLEVIADPAATLDTLNKRLIEKGSTDVKASTLATIRGDTLSVLEAIKRIHGWECPTKG